MKCRALLIAAFSGMALTVDLPAGAHSVCETSGYCESRDFSPSGPRITREWRNPNETLPYKIEIDGVALGRLIFGSLRLHLDTAGTWTAYRPDGDPIVLLLPDEPLPKSLPPITEGDYRWRLTITAKRIPIHRPGIATEDEPKLNLRIERDGKV